MALNPLDIQQKTFRVALKGYAEDEVDEFLDEIVMTIREYEQFLAEARDESEALQTRIDENRDVEASLSKALLAAQRAADQITEEARRDSERVMSDARAEASRLSVEDGREKNQLIDELDRLREIVGDVKARLADIASDVNVRIDAVSVDIDAVRGASERWEESYETPRRSAIEDLRDEEDIDDNGDADGRSLDLGWNDEIDRVVDGTAEGESEDESDDPPDDGVAPLDLREGEDDVDEGHDGDGGFVEASQTSAARRPWEHYDD